MSILLETSIGNFVVDLYLIERPRCSFNFIKLCKLKYYNYCLFHNVQPGLIAQTGDPTRTGNGGISIYNQIENKKYFQNEIQPKIKHRKAGLLSMVNNGSNLHGSQFFITLGNNLHSLDYDKHTIFGEITENIEIINLFNKSFVDRDNVPLRDIRIYHTIIIEDLLPDPKQIRFPEKSPELTEKQAKPLRIGCDEDIENDEIDPEIKEELKKLEEEKMNAQILTIIGDLPSEDVRPDERTLFVCNLNSETKDEDLEVIFSRFGEINSCEVIRDPKTGNSLQYAFIEFVDIKSCEKAYFEMERVLIDDRRIHVDFSQSVSKQRTEMLKSKRQFVRSKNESKEHKRSHDRKSRSRSIERRRERSRDKKRSKKDHRKHSSRDKNRSREIHGRDRRRH